MILGGHETGTTRRRSHGRPPLIEAGTRVLGTVAVGAGSLTVEDGAAIEGDVYVGDGVLTLAGSVGGNVAAIGGAVRLTPTGHVGGRVQIGAGGALVEAPGSRIDGGVERGVAIPDAARAPRSPIEDAAWTIARSAMLVVLLLAIRQPASGRVRAARRYLSHMPAASAAYGFLAALSACPSSCSWPSRSSSFPCLSSGLVALGFGAAIGLSAALDAVARRIGMIAASGAFVVAAAILPSLPGIGSVLMIVLLVTALGATALSLQRPQRR